MSRILPTIFLLFIVSSTTNAISQDTRVEDVYGCDGEILFENLYYGKGINLKQFDGKTALHMAVILRSSENVRFILEKGGLIEEVDDEGRTPLSHAIESENAEVVKILTENGADIHSKYRYGRTMLFYVYKDVEVARVLVESGADINALDEFGKSPLWYAIERARSENGNKDLISYLRDNGARAISLTKRTQPYPDWVKGSRRSCIILR